MFFRNVELMVFHNEGNDNSLVSMGYLSSALKQEETINVEVSFYRTDEINKAIEKTIERKPLFVGLPMLQDNFYTVFDYAVKLKYAYKDVFIVLGNKEGAFNHDFIFTNYREIDAIIPGEGEYLLS